MLIKKEKKLIIIPSKFHSGWRWISGALVFLRRGLSVSQRIWRCGGRGGGGSEAALRLSAIWRGGRGGRVWEQTRLSTLLSYSNGLLKCKRSEPLSSKLESQAKGSVTIQVRLFSQSMAVIIEYYSASWVVFVVADTIVLSLDRPTTHHLENWSWLLCFLSL